MEYVMGYNKPSDWHWVCHSAVEPPWMGYPTFRQPLMISHFRSIQNLAVLYLVGGFNPSETCQSIGMIIPDIWKLKKFQTSDQFQTHSIGTCRTIMHIVFFPQRCVSTLGNSLTIPTGRINKVNLVVSAAWNSNKIKHQTIKETYNIISPIHVYIQDRYMYVHKWGR